MTSYGIGVVGTGDISTVYLKTLAGSNLVDVVACTNRTIARAEAVAARFAIDRVHPMVDDLLADPAVDVVLNLTPPSSHAAITIASLEAGKHVYSEKTLATTMADAHAIRDTAVAADRLVACAPDTVLGGRLQTVRAMLDSDDIGRIVGGTASVVLPGLEWFHASPMFYYTAEVGPLADLGPYYIAALVSLLGPVRRCVGTSRRGLARRTARSGPFTGTPIDVEVDTHVTALLEFVDGATVSLTASFDVWDSHLPRLELYGTEGAICLPDPDPLDGPNIFGGPLWKTTSSTARFRDMPRPAEPGGWQQVRVDRPFAETSHQSNSRGIGLLDLLDALRTHRAPRLGIDLAIHVLDVVTAIGTSCREARFVEVSSRCERPTPLPLQPW